MRAVEDTALALDRACSKAEIPYALAGGVAVMAWGSPHTEARLDLVVKVTYADVERFMEAIDAEGFEFAGDNVAAALVDRGRIGVRDKDSRIAIELHLAKSEDEKSEIDSAIEVPLNGSKLRIAPPEETIAFKLKSGTAIDAEEARSVLARQAGHLDIARLRASAARLGVERALDAALDAVARR